MSEKREAICLDCSRCGAIACFIILGHGEPHFRFFGMVVCAGCAAEFGLERGDEIESVTGFIPDGALRCEVVEEGPA